ncbi:alcohol dehydrogenase catalytic domain-containing protein [Nocardia puris]|uniref:zinc-dependent alcohol dehydrogenase n=1 Tax=Nocardia puris TaxID=208602 RepID=UPI001894B29F|nr:alcohol dehydrogenase catalytic domain-containing protein [Nocardia puris]MBF6369610.1 alcohol dehydrogenase catalytic domain-containing protein [Nocardia puris]
MTVESETITPAARACGIPEGNRPRPRGWPGHLAAVATSGSAIPAARIMLEHSARERFRRLRGAVAERGDRSRGTMRALVASPGGRLRWRDVARPRLPGPGAALVHPIAAATCDLDRPMALGRTPFPLPMHFGHECVAEVVEIGEEVTTVRPGDRVVVPFQINCGTCGPCTSGLTANCVGVPPISMFGFGLTGGHWGGTFSDLLAVPFADAMLVPLPDGIDPAAAASVADNVTDGYRAIAPRLPELLARDADAQVVIFADVARRPPFSASVALYAGLVARALGARTVHLVDRRPHVRRHAEALGLHAHQLEGRRSIGRAALVVDTSGVSAGLNMAVRQTAPDGVCLSLASLHRISRIPTALMYGRNITLELARSHARAHIPAVLDLMRDGRLAPQDVTTHLGAFDRADRHITDHVRGEATKTILVE